MLQSPNPDTEKAISPINNNNTTTITHPQKLYRPTTQPFIGRLGGNQSFTSPSQTSTNALPDTTPCMPLSSQLHLSGFKCISLWKAALLEGLGSFMLNFLTIWISSSPSTFPVPSNAQWGNFNNAAFLGPLVGGLTNWVLITLFTYAFGAVTGAHLNPTITIATFFARLCSLPRMVLYVSFQTSFSALAGLMIRTALGTREFKAGGCWVDTDVVVADIAACMVHGVFYFLIPPWEELEERVQRHPFEKK
ncbi:hypothetical protein HYALB_00005077 [Hymenoscyphus albidus]|uniref:Aquaporin-like protein n=1 Tax=Hymenoscyphus albidus TaxID=595503 RepID=A0A9N9LTY4_9HELO|nr:hypothetical protein HYALB_00005077 [Hymenoscyphus albidus]